MVGLLGMDVPALHGRHFMAVDELGVVDPASGMPDHLELEGYLLRYLVGGMRFHTGFLTVRKPRR